MSLTITLVQTDVHNSLKETFGVIEQLIKDCNSDLYVLPEVFTTGFQECLPDIAHQDNGNEVIEWMTKLCREKKCGMCGGILVIDNGKSYNRLIFVDETGLLCQYDKAHLYRVGCEKTLTGTKRERVILNWHGYRIFFAICYDLRFPMFNRNNLNYDLIINPLNYGENVLRISQVLAATRAIENSAYVVCVNRVGSDSLPLRYNGHSFSYDYTGKCLIEVDDSECIGTITINKEELLEHRQKTKMLEGVEKPEFYQPYKEIEL
ncbi:CN hydrolase domain-containing protein [Entamoeba marina]